MIIYSTMFHALCANNSVNLTWNQFMRCIFNCKFKAVKSFATISWQNRFSCRLIHYMCIIYKFAFSPFITRVFYRVSVMYRYEEHRIRVCNKSHLFSKKDFPFSVSLITNTYVSIRCIRVT